MNNKNLKANSERTPSERKELARRAGVASGESRRERKLYAEIAKELGMLEVQDWQTQYQELQDILNKCGDVTQDIVVVAAQYKKAMNGDTRAAAWIRDTKGESVVNVQFDKPPIQVVDFGQGD